MVSLLPESGTGYNTLGAALREAGDLAGAVQAFERAVELAPGDRAIRSNLDRTRYQFGLALRAAGRTDEARKELKAVAQGGGEFVSLAAKAAREMGRPARAHTGSVGR